MHINISFVELLLLHIDLNIDGWWLRIPFRYIDIKFYPAKTDIPHLIVIISIHHSHLNKVSQYNL